MPGALHRLQSLVLDVDDVESYLFELTGLAVSVVEPSVSCGTNRHRDGKTLTAVSSDDPAARLDETQDELADGPCLQPLQTEQPVSVADFATHAAAALGGATRLLELDAARRQLEAALATRTVISRTVGMVRARHRCGADEESAVLRRGSQHATHELRDIAADLVNSPGRQPVASRGTSA